MARIRTVKPEMFTSESLAQVSVCAERTFVGLLTQADDNGRYRDNAAVICGVLWPLRPERTPFNVEEDLTQLADAEVVCRYTGCDGRPYLHVINWHHQKIEKKSASRLPACPVHQIDQRCGACARPCTAPKGSESTAASRLPQPAAPTPPGAAADSGRPPRPLAEESPRSPATDPIVRPNIDKGGTTESDNAVRSELPASASMAETAGQMALAEDFPTTPGGLGEASGSGSRIVDPGSSIPTGRKAPAPSATTRALIAEYIRACPNRPPDTVIGQLGRQTKHLLDEGIAPEHIRAGLERFRAKPMHPSALPSLVNEVMNPPSGRAGPPHPAYANPADAAAAYGEEL